MIPSDPDAFRGDLHYPLGPLSPDPTLPVRGKPVPAPAGGESGEDEERGADLTAYWRAFRRRWLLAYRGVEFYLHLDRLITPRSDGYFIEIKSRTWSRRDAEDKAPVISELLALFGANPDDTISDGYVQLAAGSA